MTMLANLSCPTKVTFGPDAVESLGAIVTGLNIRKALLVTGRHAVIDSGLRDRVVAILDAVGVESDLFSGVESSPLSTTVEALHLQLQENPSDCIIGIGGGSALDMAKFVAMLSTNGGQCSDYETGKAITKPSLPFIAIPTTSGSGSEVTPYSVVNNAVTGRKFTSSSPSMHPVHAIVDPLLTVGLPKMATRASGVDAWVQALEAYLSQLPNPLIDIWAEHAIRKIFKALPSVLQDPENVSARTAMSEASLLAGLSIAHVRTGMIHTLSVSLEPWVKQPHGFLNGVITPYVLNFNSGYYGNRLQNVAEWHSGHKVTSDSDAITIITDWLKSVGIPAGLATYSVDLVKVHNMVERVKQDKGLSTVNVRPFTEDDIRATLTSILEH